MPRTTRRRKRTGSRLLLAVCLCAAICLGAGKKKTEPGAVVAGTVFRDPGFSLPGATVTLIPKTDSKAKKQQAVSDARGEFAFRVPATPADYIVKASLKGFHPQVKEATVGAEGRTDVTLTLVPESNK
jgi:hypothetical protein